MLRWLPNALYNPRSERQRFFQEILLFVFAVHVVLLCGMMIISFLSKKQEKYTISLHQAGATYVLMPFQKHVTTEKNKKSKSLVHEKMAHKKSQLINYDAYQQKVSKKQKNKKTALSKAVEKSTTQAVPLPLTPQKTSLGSTRLIDKKSVASLKKKVSAKNKNKIKMVEQPTVVPQIDTQSLQVEKEEKNAMAHQSEIVVEPSAKNELQTDDVKSDQTENLIQDDVIFIGYEQLDECVVGSKIQQVIQQNWTVPVGIQSGLSCHMKVAVSAQGFAQTVTIEKGSGVFVYDNSARSTLLNIEYPREVYNKTISIVLGN